MINASTDWRMLMFLLRNLLSPIKVVAVRRIGLNAISIACIMVAASSRLYADEAVSREAADPFMSVSPQYWWSVQKFSAEDQKLVDDRVRLEHANHQRLLEVLQGKVPTMKSSQLEIFEYGTAAWLVREKFRDFRYVTSLHTTMSVMAYAGSESTPEMMRLRFLISADAKQAGDLKQLGMRLRKMYPNDYDVVYELCLLLEPDIHPGDAPLAFSLCRELKSMAPTNPTSFSTECVVYVTMWIRTHNTKYRDQALADCRRYLQLAPADRKWRLTAKWYLKHLSGS